MKNIKFVTLLCSVFFLATLQSCEEEENDLNYLDSVETPSNLELLVTLANDNSGTATFTPSGDSASEFLLDFGDGSEPETVASGEIFTHTYTEGTYTATLTASNINGETASITKEVIISFLPPQNLEITVSPVSGDAFSVNVSATAELAVGFEVFFGDVEDEQPTPLGVGEVVMHTYPAVGTYEITVIALSGGSTTLEGTTTVTIENPIVLPIDFESTTIEYEFINFGGAESTVIANPDATGENTSATVAQFFKADGAETFAGSVIELGAPIDFSNQQGFEIKTWSPAAGLVVRLKLENGTDANIFAEVDATTTVANQWETLSFDFTGATDQDYSKVIVFFDFGNSGTGSTFYFDDIEQASTSGGGDGIGLPLDFELPIESYTFVGFEGADSAIEANPDMTGENTSATVMRTIKTNGSQFFAGTFVDIDEPIDTDNSSILSIKTWSPKANIPVRLAIENQNTGNQIFVDVNTTVTNSWETLSFDFTGQIDAAVDYNRIVVFFEFIADLPGDGSTYYFDDIELVN